MKIITCSPVNTVPDLMERDITQNIVLIVQIMQPVTYICLCEKLRDQCCRTIVGSINGITICTGFIEPTLIELLIKEYKSFSSMYSTIIVLESRQDVTKFIEDYNVTNDKIIGKLLCKRFGENSL